MAADMPISEIRLRLASRRVGIAGCGGLGSNCAVALARSGVGTLVVVDFDTVSEENLNRQYFFREHIGRKKVAALVDVIRRIDPRVKVEGHEVRLDPRQVLRIFAGCEVIVEAFDRADMKQMIAETVLAGLPDAWLVIGSGLAGFGANAALHTRRTGRLFICGDEELEVSDAHPPLAPRVGIVAAMQANQVLEILLDESRLPAE